MKLLKLTLASLFWFSLTSHSSVSASQSAPSDPALFLEYNRFAESLWDVGIIDDCTYSTSIVDFAYPNNGSHTGWVVPGANEDSDYAEAFDRAAETLHVAFEIISENQCQTVNNKRCCVQGAIERCRKDPNKHCKMDAANQWCVVGSHQCS